MVQGAGKYFTLLLLFLLVHICLPVASFSQDIPGIVRVGIYQNQPKIFIDEKGRASGFWPDLVDYIAEQEGWKIQYILGTWEECLQRLENGQIDVMPDVAYTEERAARFVFSKEPVYTSWSRVYANKGVKIDSILDLEGKTIAVLKGSVNVEGPEGIKRLTVAYDIHCTYIELETYEAVFDAVSRGVADAGVVSKDFGNLFETEYKVSRTPVIFQPSQLYFCFPKGSHLTPQLIPVFDSHITKLKADNKSIYYRSMEKWLSVRPQERTVIPAWLLWMLIAFGGLLLFFASGSYILRKQVDIKTRELKQEIVQHKEAQRQLEEYKNHLEDMVLERTAELEQKNRELSEANWRLQEVDRLKSIFLASMSHELRTPLNSIIGFTGIMLKGMAGKLNPEQEKQMNIVKNSATHLLNLINDILDISRIEAGRIELALEEFRLKDVIEEVVNSFATMAGEKGLKISADVHQDAVLFSDKRRVKQVLMNLLSNAVKFTEKGGVSVCADLIDGDNVEVRVSDTGIGIKDEDMHRLFEPFQQVGASLTKRHEGTGLGLYLTKKLSMLLGGGISATSQYGKGSEFVFTVPLRYNGAQARNV